MSFDPLAQYRKKTVYAPEQSPPTGTPDEYVAFNAKDGVDRLKIRTDDLTYSPGYVHLLFPVYDTDHGTFCNLAFTCLVVLIHGRNLQPVIAALEMGVADFIQEYDAKKWPKPKDDKLPFIESIKVVVQENGPVPAPGNKTGKAGQQDLNLH